ncbi:MAG: Flp pilus assembly complex ATPase component TadA [Opitutaceae bacterium]|nr:Flp pilus assembly complex ATPase component TadA [Opitutaceae bacterium]
MSSATADDYLLELAVAEGLLTAAQVESARARTNGGSPYAALMLTGELDAGRVTALLARRFGMATVELAKVQVTSDVLALVTAAQARHYRLLPLARANGTLRVAVADPLETDGIDALSHLHQLNVEPVLAAAPDLDRALRRFYGEPETEGPATPAPITTPAGTAPRAEVTASDAPIIRLVESFITEAVKLRASDIHLEPLERRFRVRYRVDGVLIPGASPPKRLQAAIISRVKIMAGMSIAEKRLPQDGRITFNVDGNPLDLRVSSLPGAHGEGVVMRLLDQQSLRYGLPELGFMPDDEATFARLIRLSDGILLVTGPTGSGKTTTLYSCLHAINQPDRKIITVEDPVEYQLAGVNQVPVRPEVGMTFAAALRAMLRQAPNVVMVGEIRDGETAEIAIHASLTGHLVFSTLHTNDAPGAVTRLIDIGVKPFLVSTSLRGVMAQRLVRRICPACAEVHRPGAAELRLLDIPAALAEGATFRRGRGCPECHGTGYRGRLGIFEILVVDDELRRLIHDGAPAAKLRAHARAAGMRTLREDGVRKIIAGLTTVEEVVSMTVGDAS